MNKLKVLWASLPHPVQCMLIAALTAAGTTFLHSVAEGPCFTATCLKHSLGLSLGAALAVARAFYMMPNGTADKLRAQGAQQALAQQQAQAAANGK